MLRPLACALIALSLCLAIPVFAQQRPLRIGFVAFLSGPGATSVGKPSQASAEALVEALSQSASAA